MPTPTPPTRSDPRRATVTRRTPVTRRLAARATDGVLLAVAAWLLVGPRGAFRPELDGWLESRRRAERVEAAWSRLVATGGTLGGAPHASRAPRATGAPPATGGTEARTPTPTLVVFTDYRCPYCRVADGSVSALLGAEPSVRVRVRHLPVAELHPDAPVLARVSVCAEGEPTWPAVHRALFDLPSPRTAEGPPRAVLLDLLAAAGVEDPNGVLGCADGPVARARVEADRALARELRIDGTPAFVAPGRLTVGALSPDGLREMLGLADPRPPP